MNECVKNIMKIYIFILVILYILLGKFSFIHIYSVLLILNSTIGICGFLVNTSYSDLNKDNIYKHISMVFAFSGIINLVYAFSMLMYKHEYQHINTITHIGFLGIGVEILLTMYILNKHKNEINIKKIINTLIILTVLSLLVLCRTSVIPMVYSKSGITVYSFIVEIVYIIGAIYIIKI
ncbi:hypothetical protein [Romboutsia sp. Marseille-P6047]|uniref:hypothetical protein n=1 Tax=Romboutsia sp. Marseille-P6047 TaxID=2161817 RepID=UPI000F04D3BE|nr:hypothetical protein [Romboutsia sp. Marseille-P6047]